MLLPFFGRLFHCVSPPCCFLVGASFTTSSFLFGLLPYLSRNKNFLCIRKSYPSLPQLRFSIETAAPLYPKGFDKHQVGFLDPTPKQAVLPLCRVRTSLPGDPFNPLPAPHCAGFRCLAFFFPSFPLFFAPGRLVNFVALCDELKDFISLPLLLPTASDSAVIG